MCLTPLWLGSCGYPELPRNAEQFGQVQEVVDQIVVTHARLVRLTVHAVPAGQTESKIIACNIREKIGKTSDPEDIDAMRTRKPVILREGTNLDVTMPILNDAGQVIGATGITFRDDGSGDENELIAEARRIAEEVAAGIQSAKDFPDDENP